VVGAAIVEGPRVLVARRGAAMSAPGQWELPGGKVRPGEPAAAALAREVFEELGLSIEVGAHLGHGSALGEGRRIRLEAFLASLAAGEAGRLELREHEEARWFVAADLGALDWSEADRPILPRLAAALAARQEQR
jgi:8-oxo-dGTP diphosphatase